MSDPRSETRSTVNVPLRLAGTSTIPSGLGLVRSAVSFTGADVASPFHEYSSNVPVAA